MEKLFYNGVILTMETEETAEAVLVRDGKIAAVGTLEAVCAQAKNAEKVDLQGQTLLPAFIDAHGHFSGAANALLQVPLEEATTFEEIDTRIRAFIQENAVPSGEWVLAKGYDHNQLTEKAHPDRALLDRIAPEHPLALQHKSGHVGVFNTCALEKLGVTIETPVPSGGVIAQRDGELTGYMEENAFISYLQQVPMPDVGTLLEAYGRVQAKYAAHGITTVQEGMLPLPLAPLYKVLLERGLLRLDVVGYADFSQREEVLAAFPHADRQYDRHFKLGGYKIFLDGSPQGRTAWMRTPYHGGEPENYGYGTMDDAAVENAVRTAATDRRQLLAHCNGDAACAQYLRAVETVETEIPDLTRQRPVMIHAQLLGIDQLPAVKRCGILPSFFVAHVYHWGDVHIENFGRERAERISPAYTAQKTGIRYTFHQDAPVIDPDMLETVWCAVNRRTKAGVQLGAQERVSVLDALKAVTIHAAYQYFEENEKGSIRVGKKADLVILDRNPLDIPPEELRTITVLETLKNGETIFAR